MCGFGSAVAAFHSPTSGAMWRHCQGHWLPLQSYRAWPKLMCFLAENKTTHTAFSLGPSCSATGKQWSPPPIAQGQPDSWWPAACMCSQQLTAFQVREDRQNILAQISPDFNCLNPFSVPRLSPGAGLPLRTRARFTTANQCNPHRWAVSETEGTAGGHGTVPSWSQRCSGPQGGSL